MIGWYLLDRISRKPWIFRDNVYVVSLLLAKLYENSLRFTIDLNERLYYTYVCMRPTLRVENENLWQDGRGTLIEAKSA
jgi:hypothetical protein